MIADAFDDRSRSRIPNAEPLGSDAAKISFAFRRSIQRDVANENVFFRGKRRFLRRINNYMPARESFADVVVGIAFQLDGDSLCQPCSNTLAG